jgi:hypothetical protein
MCAGMLSAQIGWANWHRVVVLERWLLDPIQFERLEKPNLLDRLSRRPRFVHVDPDGHLLA